MSATSAPLVRARSSRMASAARPTTSSAAVGSHIEVPSTPIRSFTEAEIGVRRLIADLLDTVVQDAGVRGYAAATADMIVALHGLRTTLGDEMWISTAVPAAREHPIATVMHQDPLTGHAFRRPRGYPGDAGLMDLVYGHADVAGTLAGATDLGLQVYECAKVRPVCEGAKLRTEKLARFIDQTAARRPGADVLVVACGHLREVEFSSALPAGGIGRFLATDQDPRSLAVCEGYARSVSTAIETRKLGVRDFISGKHDLGRFDAVYASGLYDYLDDRIAMRLTRRLFGLLKPGGRLLVANYLTGTCEVAFMEAFGDWMLLYRNREQIEAFADEISDTDVAGRAYSEDAIGCVGYLELERA